jgi:hypothetical protein
MNKLKEHKGSRRVKKFQPSEKSQAPGHEAAKVVVALQYISEAALQLEAQARLNPLPSWVESRVVQAAALLGTAMGYVNHQHQRDVR